MARGYRGRGDDANKEDTAEYKAITESIVEKIKPEEKPIAEHILRSERAHKGYQILRDHHMPERTIKRMMAQSLSRGGELTPAVYAKALAEELQMMEGYAGVVNEMYEEGVLSRSQYREIQSEIEHQTERRIHRLGDLERTVRRAAAIILIIVGAVLILVSGSVGLTGAVVGSRLSMTPMTFIIGFISFVAGLLLETFSKRQ